MVSTSEGSEVELMIKTLEVLINLKEKSGKNVDLYQKIEKLEIQIVERISKNLHM